MLTFAWYLLKVMLVSGVLSGYYWLALRNKKFHLYNRFYLLASIVLSWIIPLLKINFWEETTSQPQIINLLAVVASGDRFVEETKAYRWSWNAAGLTLFVFISVLFLIRMIRAIIKIRMLIGKNPSTKWSDIKFVFTDAKGTPFSFFKYIFWNTQIDLHSHEGEQILKHELAHVRERHTVDKMFLSIVFIVGWYNPFVWLIHKELNLIHEFIADKKAVRDGDTASFAAMLLKSAYPQYSFPLANSFFYSPVKRRLLMLTTSKKTSFTYLRRIAILPLLMFTCVLFAFSLKKGKINSHGNKTISGNKITIEPAYKVGEEKANDAIPDDTTKRKGKTVSFSNITINNRGNNVVTVEGSKAFLETEKLHEVLIVLDGKSILEEELEKIIKPENIREITILNAENGLKKYGEKGKHGAVEIRSGVQGEQSDIQVQGGHITEKYQEEQNEFDKVFTKVENPPAYKGDVAFAEYIKANLRYPSNAIAKKKEGKAIIKFIVDQRGNLTNFKAVSSLGSGLEEEAIRLIKNSSPWTPAIQNGRKVIFEVIQEINFSLSPQAVAADDETPAEFPGGADAWKRYLEKNLNANVLAEHHAPSGYYSVVLKFTVHKDGSITDIKAQTKLGYGTEEEAIKVIKKGPKWVPGKKDGRFIDSEVKQTITFLIDQS
jgi:TonB family protein